METTSEELRARHDFGSVRVYRLAPAGAVLRHAEVMARELFGLRDLESPDRAFTIHPASGFIFYADHGALWQNPLGSDLPSDTSEAERLARAFLADANRAIAGSHTMRRARIRQIFPTDLRPLWIGGIIPKGSNRADHWLCRFAVHLPVDHQRTARVEGAAVELRLGRHGRVIGLTSRWRSIVGDLISVERDHERRATAIHADPAGMIRRPQFPQVPVPPAPPRENAHANAEHHHAHADEPAEFLYWLEDEDAPQVFLSPVYLEGSGEHRAVRAASAHTLRVEIRQRTSGARIELLAIVSGGSGDYAYQWAQWSAGAFPEQGLTMLGTSMRESVDIGASQILVAIRDRQTGAVVQTENAVYPRA